jgi:hypothetical protein
MVFCFWAFGFKIGLDTVLGDEFAVGISGVDGIGAQDFQFFMGKT